MGIEDDHSKSTEPIDSSIDELSKTCAALTLEDEPFPTSAHACILRNNLTEMELAICTHGPEFLDAVNSGGYTALHLATATHNIAAIDLLLAGGADPTIMMPDGRTALHVAIKLRGVKVLDLTEAIAIKGTRALEYALKSTDKPSLSYVEYAIEHRNLYALGILLDYGCSPESSHQDFVSSPLTRSIDFGDVGMMALLLQHDAKVVHFTDETPVGHIQYLMCKPPKSITIANRMGDLLIAFDPAGIDVPINPLSELTPRAMMEKVNMTAFHIANLREAVATMRLPEPPRPVEARKT